MVNCRTLAIVTQMRYGICQISPIVDGSGVQVSLSRASYQSHQVMKDV